MKTPTDSTDNNKSELDIGIDDDKPTAIASNGQINGLAFNMELIEAENPALAKEIRRLHKEAERIKSSDMADAHEEDVALLSETFKDLLEKEE